MSDESPAVASMSAEEKTEERSKCYADCTATRDSNWSRTMGSRASTKKEMADGSMKNRNDITRDYEDCRAKCQSDYGTDDSLKLQGLQEKVLQGAGPTLEASARKIIECAEEYIQIREQMWESFQQQIGVVHDAAFRIKPGEVMNQAGSTNAAESWEDWSEDVQSMGTASDRQANASMWMLDTRTNQLVTGFLGNETNAKVLYGAPAPYKETSEQTEHMAAQIPADNNIPLKWTGEITAGGVREDRVTAFRALGDNTVADRNARLDSTGARYYNLQDNPNIDLYQTEAELYVPERSYEWEGYTKQYFIQPTRKEAIAGNRAIANGSALAGRYPWYWATWLTAFARQAYAICGPMAAGNDTMNVERMMNFGPTQELVDAAKSNVPGALTALTYSMIGSKGSSRQDVYSRHFWKSPYGVLKYGAPAYWPANSVNLIWMRHLESQTRAGGVNSGRRAGLFGTTRLDELGSQLESAGAGTPATTGSNAQAAVPPNDLSGLQQQHLGWYGDKLADLAVQIGNLPATVSAADSDGDSETVGWNSEHTTKMQDVFQLFANTMTSYHQKLLEAAQCVFDADKEGDDKLNEELAKLKGEFDQFGWEPLVDDEDWDNQVEDLIRSLRGDAESRSNVFGMSPEKVLYKEQCFLLSFVALLSDYKKKTLDLAGSPSVGTSGGSHKALPYVNTTPPAASATPEIRARQNKGETNASLLVDGDPYGFINKLTRSPYTSRLYNIENWEMSNLQPLIRLFKVIYDGNGNEREVEIKFNSHFNKKEMDTFKDRTSRGAGVGLKSFNFTYDGSNPFAAKKSIKGTLKLFANSFRELLVDRPGNDSEGGTHIYKYVELALKTGSPRVAENCNTPADYLAAMEQNEQLSKLNFRLKAVVGWNAPDGLSGLRQRDKQHLKKALDDSYVTLNLTPTIHDFDFDEQGRVTFNINYLAYVEDFFDQSGYNVFADPSGNIAFRRLGRELKMKSLQRECGEVSPSSAQPAEGGGDSPEQQAANTIATAKEQFAREVEADALESVSKLLWSLSCSDKIYYINIPTAKLKNFVQRGPFADYTEYHEQHRAGNFVMNNEAYGSQVATSIKHALSSRRSGQAGYLRAGEGHDPGRKTKNQVAAALLAVNPNDNNLPFFYVSDLIDQVLYNIDAEFVNLKAKLGEVDVNQWLTNQCEVKQKISQLELYKTNFKRLRLLFGPVEFVHHKVADGNPSVFVNFGDIPISVKYFVEWLTNKVLQREETVYPLTKFLNDFFNTLVRDFLNNDSCFIYNIAQKVRVNQSVLTSYVPEAYRTGTENPNIDDVTYKILKIAGRNATRINLSQLKQKISHKLDVAGKPICLEDSKIEYENSYRSLPLLNVNGNTGTAVTYAPLKNEMNYFVFFAGRTMPTEKMNGVRCQDEDRGIQHYFLGRDKGLIKNIKLSKTDSKGLAEVRFEQDGYDGLRQLRVVYDVEIDSFANVQTYPGTYIFIPPRGFDPSVAQKVSSDGFDLTDLGIGGYYMIIRSEHEFGEGYANTKIHAKWVAQIDNQAQNTGNNLSRDTRGATGKCGIYANRIGLAKGER